MMILNEPLPVVFVLGLAAFLTGLSKGGLGGMLGALTTPMVVMVLPLDQAVGLMLPILMVGDTFAIIAHWRRWESRLIGMLLLGALVGVMVGTYVITGFPPEILKRGLGIIVLLFVAYRLLENKFISLARYQTKRWHGVLAGSISGFTSTLAHAGGPPAAIYLLMQNLQPAAFVATAALFIAILNWIKVPYYYYAGLFDFKRQISLAWLLLLVPVGVWLGKFMVNRIDKVWFDRVILFFLIVAAVFLLRP